jgi:hypothetical protein
VPSPMDLLRATVYLNKLMEISCKGLYIHLVILENIRILSFINLI